MSIEHIQLEFWHVLLFFGTIFIGIFKSDIVAWIEKLLILKRRRFPIGETVEIQEVDGSWSPLIIRGYTRPSLFGAHGGGVLVEHLATSSETKGTHEKLSLTQWGSLRIRRATESPGAAPSISSPS